MNLKIKPNRKLKTLKPWLKKSTVNAYKRLGYNLIECLCPTDYKAMYTNGPHSCMRIAAFAPSHPLIKAGLHPRHSIWGNSPYIRGIYIQNKPSKKIVWRSICRREGVGSIYYVRGYGKVPLKLLHLFNKQFVHSTVNWYKIRSHSFEVTYDAASNSFPRGYIEFDLYSLWFEKKDGKIIAHVNKRQPSNTCGAVSNW